MAVVPFKRARRRLLIWYYLITDEGPVRMPLRLLRDLVSGDIAAPQFANSFQRKIEVLIWSTGTACGSPSWWTCDGIKWISTATLHVRRVKQGTPSTHPILGDELRALRRLQREQEPKSPFVFTSERGAPFSTAGFARMVERAGREAKLAFKAHPHMLRHACGYALGQQGPRHPRAASLPRPPQYSAYRPVHRAITDAVQGFLAGLSRSPSLLVHFDVLANNCTFELFGIKKYGYNGYVNSNRTIDYDCYGASAMILIGQAISLHQQGNFVGAEAIYKKVLHIDSLNDFDALHMLENLYNAQRGGHIQEAEKLCT